MDMNTLKTAAAPEVGLGGFEFYTLQDYKRMLWRRRWTIVSTTLIAALLTAVVAYFVPNVYKASTIILVDPKKVPDNLVASTATSASDRLSSLRQQVLSNTRLSQIIDEMNLYPEMKKHKTQEEIIGQMLKDTEVEILATSNNDKTLGAFRISYSSRSPQSAAQVANRLASLFIVQNMKEREQQVLGTAEFMDRELAEVKKGLDARKERLQEARKKYVAALPESEAVHGRAISTLELELRADMDAMSRGEQQKVLMQSMLANTPAVVNLDTGGDAGDVQTHLASLEADRDQLLARYGPDYPDVKSKSAEIEKLEKKLKDQEKATADVGKDAASAPRSKNPVIESQIAALESEMQKLAAHEKMVKEQLEFHQAKLAEAPVLDQELQEAKSSLDEAQDSFNKLAARKTIADMSQDMEARQKGERFVVLEPALPPEKPSSPDRPLINGIGFGAGLLLGVLVAFALEIFDTTVKTQREITQQFPVPIFGEIPWLPTAAGTRRQHIRSLVAAATNCVLALAFLAIVYLTY